MLRILTLLTILILNVFQTFGSVVPRFVCVRASEANLHVGPGLNYPVAWKFVRKGLPLEVIAEFDTWRQVRDWQGTQGWIHKSLLSGIRTALVIDKIRHVYRKPDQNSTVVAKLEPEVIVKPIECQGQWCKIEVQDKQNSIKFKAWIMKKDIWGIYPDEVKFS
jgi:SH3-like domain-containing protein